MKITNQYVKIASIISILVSLPALAPAQVVGPQPQEEAPKGPDYFPDSNDPAVAEMTRALIGMYRGDDHTLYINEVELPDAGPALYVELVLAGEENKPLRQQLWIPHTRNGTISIRVNDLPMGMRDLVVGMWAAPSIFPKAGLSQYAATGDLVVDTSGGEFRGRSPAPMPITDEGAIEYVLRFEHTSGGMRWIDSGRAINGDELFSLDLNMKKRPSMPVATELDGGILIYDLRDGFTGPSPVEKDSIVFYFSEWTMQGYLIDTSDQPNRGGQYFKIPNDERSIRSWNLGVIGLREGGVRRIYDPASESGIFQGEAKPFKTPMAIISVLECISVKDNTPDK